MKNLEPSGPQCVFRIYFDPETGGVTFECPKIPLSMSQMLIDEIARQLAEQRRKVATRAIRNELEAEDRVANLASRAIHPGTQTQ